MDSHIFQSYTSLPTILPDFLLSPLNKLKAGGGRSVSSTPAFAAIHQENVSQLLFLVASNSAIALERGNPIILKSLSDCLARFTPSQ